MMKGVLVTIAGNDLACARTWDAACERRVRGENPSGFSTRERYLTSYLGYLAWLRWCRIYGLRCVYRVVTEGRSVDNSKFTLFRGGTPQPCLVKTASFSFHKQMMLPVKQTVDDAALYVGMRLRCDADMDVDTVTEIDVECCGQLPGADVALLPVTMVKVLTRCCSLDDLRPLTRVRDDYDRGALELRGRAVELEASPPLRLT